MNDSAKVRSSFTVFLIILVWRWLFHIAFNFLGVVDSRAFQGLTMMYQTVSLLLSFAALYCVWGIAVSTRHKVIYAWASVLTLSALPGILYFVISLNSDFAEAWYTGNLWRGLSYASQVLYLLEQALCIASLLVLARQQGRRLPLWVSLLYGLAVAWSILRQWLLFTVLGMSYADRHLFFLVGSLVLAGWPIVAVAITRSYFPSASQTLQQHPDIANSSAWQSAVVGLEMYRKAILAKLIFLVSAILFNYLFLRQSSLSGIQTTLVVCGIVDLIINFMMLPGLWLWRKAPQKDSQVLTGFAVLSMVLVTLLSLWLLVISFKLLNPSRALDVSSTANKLQYLPSAIYFLGLTSVLLLLQSFRLAAQKLELPNVAKRANVLSVIVPVLSFFLFVFVFVVGKTKLANPSAVLAFGFALLLAALGFLASYLGIISQLVQAVRPPKAVATISNTTT